jgi:hypothetical protein
MASGGAYVKVCVSVAVLPELSVAVTVTTHVDGTVNEMLAVQLVRPVAVPPPHVSPDHVTEVSCTLSDVLLLSPRSTGEVVVVLDPELFGILMAIDGGVVSAPADKVAVNAETVLFAAASAAVTVMLFAPVASVRSAVHVTEVGPEFAKVAEGFGVKGFVATTPAEYRAALADHAREQAAYEKKMAAWREAVRRCRAGDTSYCDN